MGQKSIPWIIFIIINASLFFFFSYIARLEPAGDIAEYYGITESVISHTGISLTPEDKDSLEKVLHPAYFEDPQYYIKGRAGLRYPVHFFFYSLLAVPIRILIQIIGGITLNSLAITNVVILALAVSYILLDLTREKHKLSDEKKGLVRSFFTKPVFFLLLIYLSPFMWFLAWPGPDVFYMSMLLLSFYFISKKRFFVSLFFAVLASWHSQPLIIIVLGISAFIIAFEKLSRKTIYTLIFMGLLALVPYLYNFYIFGALTPWMLFENGWTQLNGFGFQNIQAKKLFEQFFDLNIGLFWFMPTALLMSIYIFYNLKNKKTLLFPLFVLLVTAFMYQTNPAWHYGTSGYGPTRHILFIVPLLLIFITTLFYYFKDKTIKIFLASYIISQLIILSFVGFITPNFQKTLYHTPLAHVVLLTAPWLYNPTPEIFTDRTNHADPDRPSSAFYMNQNSCKKAYVLITEKDLLEKTCGHIPEAYEKLFDNPYTRRANYSRPLITTDAVFYPDPDSCDKENKSSEFVCIRSKDEFAEKSDIKNLDVIEAVTDNDQEGVWSVTSSLPLRMTVPPGYIVDHVSFEGVYVNY